MYLEIKDVKKSYGEDGSFVQVLNGITTEVGQGEMCVIQGTSGSGKSTLLNCIGGLDTMDSGSVKVAGTEIFGMKREKPRKPIWSSQRGLENCFLNGRMAARLRSLKMIPNVRMLRLPTSTGW